MADDKVTRDPDGIRHALIMLAALARAEHESRLVVTTGLHDL